MKTLSQIADELDAGNIVSLITQEDKCRIAQALRGADALTHHQKWRHKARGSVYTEIGRGRLQSASPGGLTDMELMVIYLAADGSLWVRDKTEFEDGRFEKANA